MDTFGLLQFLEEKCVLVFASKEEFLRERQGVGL